MSIVCVYSYSRSSQGPFEREKGPDGEALEQDLLLALKLHQEEEEQRLRLQEALREADEKLARELALKEQREEEERRRRKMIEEDER